MALSVKTSEVLLEMEILIVGMSYQWHRSHRVVKTHQTNKVTILNPKNTKLECFIYQTDLSLETTLFFSEPVGPTTTDITDE